MNSINAKLENGVLTLSLSGKIDSLNMLQILSFWTAISWKRFQVPG